MGSGGRGNAMIWSALHGNMQRPERAGMELASHPEQMVKRACFTWGIGRELYTAPRIFVYADKCKSLKQGKNGKMQCYDHFSVAKIKVVDGRIVGLAIRNDDTGRVVFTYVEDGYGKEQ